MKLRYILFGAALSASLVSCNEKEFLDVPPQGSLNDAVLNSAEGLPYLMNAAYSALAGPTTTFGAMNSPVNHWLQGELRSDNAYKGGGGPSDNTNFHLLETNVVDATHASMNNWWTALYSSVKRTNAALQALEASDPAAVPGIEVYKAEMRVLRAHYYFELSREFNKIPWIDETMAEKDYVNVRNDELTRDEILGKIAKELEECAEILPESSPQVGRANKYVAYAYAAKVYLYKAYRQDASNNVTSIDKTDLAKVVEYTDKVIKSGKYDLLPDFQQLDMIAHENGKESIWAVQYSINDGATMSLPWAYCGVGHVNWSALLNTPKGPYNGDNFFYASQDLVNAYKTGADGLPLLDGSWQDSDYDLVNETTSGDSKIYTNYNNESNVDPRLDFVVGRINVRWKSSDQAVDINWYRDVNSYGYHIIKRFLVSPESGDLATTYPWGNSALNFQIIRYASVLLWRAEALVELGSNLDEARELVNMVRNRAKNSPYVTAMPGSAVDFNGYAANYAISEYPSAGWTQDYARKAVRHETRIETALEGERLFDLVRWGIATETMNRYFSVEKSKRIYYANCKWTSGKDEYYPVPLTQYNLSKGAYSQNPGYAQF